MKGILESKEDIAKGTGYFRFTVDEDLDFKSGQYFHIKFRDDLKHHFTIVNSPNEQRAVSVATRLRDSEFKRTLQALPIGGEVEIYKIKGEFVLPEQVTRPLMFIALGIGITPYISMLRYIREQLLPFDVTLIYSDSDRASMAFFSELESFAKDNPRFKLIVTVTSDPTWSGERLRVNRDFLEKYIPDPAKYLYFVSGPPKAVESVTGSLAELNIPADQIKSENFTGY